MAADVATLMRGLGHDRFGAVGHDRGRHVAVRLALDDAGSVSALVVLDGVPIGEAFNPGGHPFRHRVVDLVLLRPARQTPTSDPCRPGRGSWSGQA